MLEIISKDNTKCMYDYAEDIYEIEKTFEIKEKRKMTAEERLILACILKEEDFNEI